MDDEAREEIESHIAMRTDLNRSLGMSDDDARRAAVNNFGNATQIRETIYELNGFGFLDSVGQDLRHGLRHLYKNKSWTIVAILALGIGIVLNAGSFGFSRALYKSYPCAIPTNW
jgi:hypothetical protein